MAPGHILPTSWLYILYLQILALSALNLWEIHDHWDVSMYSATNALKRPWLWTTSAPCVTSLKALSKGISLLERWSPALTDSKVFQATKVFNNLSSPHVTLGFLQMHALAPQLDYISTWTGASQLHSLDVIMRVWKEVFGGRFKGAVWRQNKFILGAI